MDKILAGQATDDIKERAKAARFDERLSLLGLLLDAVTADLRETVETEQMLHLLLDVLKSVKAELALPDADPLEVLDRQIAAQQALIDTGKRSGSLSRETERARRRILAALRRQRELVVQSGAGQDAFPVIKADFDRMVQGLKAQARQAGEKLSNLFRFCEEVFPDGQELLILVTELTVSPYSAKFISRYGCKEYFAHNKELLFYERQQEILSQLEELDLT